MPLVTIAIPTYNRASSLKKLLDRIFAENNHLLGNVLFVWVSDNASTDVTKEVLASYKGRSGFDYISNPENIGADLNIASCFASCITEYIWILGDDDLPMPGCVSNVVATLRVQRPNLFYIPAKWVNEIEMRDGCHEIKNYKVGFGSARNIATRSHIYITFLSSWIVRRAAYVSRPDSDIKRLVGTNLVQLEWHFLLLEQIGNYAWAENEWIVATAGNSGGYSVLNIFHHNFNKIVLGRFSQDRDLRLFYADSMKMLFIPGLIWNMRFESAGEFSSCSVPDMSDTIRDIYRQQWLMRVLVGQIGLASPRVARFAKIAASVLGRAWISIQRFKIR